MDEWADIHWVLQLDPIPCPRPRVTRKGWAYFPKKYSGWKRDADSLISETMKSFGFSQPLAGELEVNACFYARRPKTTKLPFPKPDIDNYLKALLDAGNGIAWADDSQVSVVRASKVWAQPNEDGYIEVIVRYRNDANSRDPEAP